MHSVCAHADAMLFALPRDAFLTQLDADPRRARACLEILRERSQAIYSNLADEALLNLGARLAKYLLRLVDQHGRTDGKRVALDLKLNQDDLAAMLAVSRQSLNRELRQMETEALISIAYAQTTILDAPALRRLVPEAIT